MTRKDYQIIARALFVTRAEDRSGPGYTVWQHTVHVMADALARDNSRFDRERFYAACEA